MKVLATCTMDGTKEHRRVIEIAGYYFLQSHMNRNPDGLPSFTLHLSEEEAKQSVKELEAYNGTLKGGE